jgi:uncharacterized protein (DUF4415 family)
VELEFEWDEEKARTDLAKHRVSFLTAAELLPTRYWSGSTTGKTTERFVLSRSALSIQKCTGSFSPGAAKISSASSAPRKRAEMKGKSTTVRHSRSQVRAMRERGEDKTSPDAPDAKSLGADFWKSARVVVPGGKTSVHLRLDSDVVEWFKANGKGHLTRMNAVLRAYVEAQKH